MKKKKNCNMKLDRVVITLFFLVFFLFSKCENVYAIESTQGNHLIQSTNDEAMWDGYIRLGIEKLYIRKDDTFDEIEKNVKYSCVKLSCYEDKAETETNGIGSGFILNITNDKMYIVTAKHIIRYAAFGKCKVDYLPEEFNEKTFSMRGIGDYSSEKIQKELHTATVVYSSKSCDFAVVVVDISNLDYSYRYEFKEMSNFVTDDLRLNQNLHFYATDKYAKNINLKTVKIVNVGDLENRYNENYIWTTSGAINGDSGSLLFNENGEAVSLIFGVYSGPEGIFTVSVAEKLFLSECEKYMNDLN